MRKNMRNPSDGASPQKNDAVVNPMTAPINRRLRPKRPASQPVRGRTIALATRYDVTVQVASSTEADRLPAIWGSDTLTTVVSSTSMKVLDITAIAISQGLMSGCACSCAWELIVTRAASSSYIRFIAALKGSGKSRVPEKAGFRKKPGSGKNRVQEKARFVGRQCSVGLPQL